MTAILERRKARLLMRREARRSLSAGLQAWMDSDEPSTLGTLNHAFGEKVLAAGCLAMMAPSALPVPSGGATHVFDVIALVFAVQLALARTTVWLPSRWATREVGTKTRKVVDLLIRFVRWCERFSRPRLSALLERRPVRSVIGTVMVVFVLAAMFSPPFTGLDTLPSLGVVLLALALLLGDALFAVVGSVFGVAGIVLAIGFATQISHVVHRILP